MRLVSQSTEGLAMPFPTKFRIASQALRIALVVRGLTAWPVSKRSDAFKLGLFWGVSLSWPHAEDIMVKKEIKSVRSTTKFIARKFGLEPNIGEPAMAAGGVLVIYCGFKAPVHELAKKKS